MILTQVSGDNASDHNNNFVIMIIVTTCDNSDDVDISNEWEMHESMQDIPIRQNLRCQH